MNALGLAAQQLADEEDKSHSKDKAAVTSQLLSPSQAVNVRYFTSRHSVYTQAPLQQSGVSVTAEDVLQWAEEIG